MLSGNLEPSGCKKWGSDSYRKGYFVEKDELSNVLLRHCDAGNFNSPLQSTEEFQSCIISAESLSMTSSVALFQRIEYPELCILCIVKVHISQKQLADYDPDMESPLIMILIMESPLIMILIMESPLIMILT